MGRILREGGTSGFIGGCLVDERGESLAKEGRLREGLGDWRGKWGTPERLRRIWKRR